MKRFRTLDLAIEFYQQINKIKISGNLKDQLHRAASSISLNLSEGNAKASQNEKRHFFQTAYGSLRECQTIFKLIHFDDAKTIALADQLGGHLYKLVNSNLKDSPNYHRKSGPSSDI